MIFALITLLAALSLAAIADWFSIIGFIAIYAAAPTHALIMGIVLALAKLVTTSWVYRNWEFADWKLKTPLIGFILALMIATSIGTFGFLSKAHLEQGASTIDNSAKVERLDQQITREKSTISDDEKVITQLDATINSYIEKDRTDKSLAVRKSQAPQRKQLRDDIDASQKRIDAFSDEKLKLQSEVRKQQLDVGPIRYIAELFYGVTEDASKNIEAAVRIFTLLIVSTLDPLAVILLVAANHTIMRRENEKKEKLPPQGIYRQSELHESPTIEEAPSETPNTIAESDGVEDIETGDTISVEDTSPPPEENTVHVPILPEAVGLLDEEKVPTLEEFQQHRASVSLPIIRQPNLSRVMREDSTPIRPPVASISPPVQDKIREIEKPRMQDAIMREVFGSSPHFIPQKVHEEEKLAQVETPTTTAEAPPPETRGQASEIKKIQQEGQGENVTPPEVQGVLINSVSRGSDHKYPKALSWLTEFKRT